MRVLVVDDSKMALELLRNAVAHAGYEVLTASNGAEALEIIRSGAARLVVSDWEMPQMNGPELCRAIRADHSFGGSVYIIMLTAREGENDAVEGLHAGADEFIQKPFRPAELIARLRAGERILSVEARDLTVLALAKLAESRDPGTGQHVERVREFATLLAEDLARQPKHAAACGPAFSRLIYLTSPLHDIGKLTLPDAVLLKPGRLNDAEFQIMKSHTTSGAETLAVALKQFPDAKYLQIACQIAETHHERWDGTGYPKGLKGADIPLCGRIMALADVYDAMTTKRVYKPAFDHQVVRAMIVESRGSHFDPDVVDAFVRLEQGFLDVRRKYAPLSAPAEAA